MTPHVESYYQQPMWYQHILTNNRVLILIPVHQTCTIALNAWDTSLLLCVIVICIIIFFPFHIASASLASCCLLTLQIMTSQTTRGEVSMANWFSLLLLHHLLWLTHTFFLLCLFYCSIPVILHCWFLLRSLLWLSTFVNLPCYKYVLVSSFGVYLSLLPWCSAGSLLWFLPLCSCSSALRFHAKPSLAPSSVLLFLGLGALHESSLGSFLFAPVPQHWCSFSWLLHPSCTHVSRILHLHSICKILNQTSFYSLDLFGWLLLSLASLLQSFFFCFTPCILSLHYFHLLSIWLQPATMQNKSNNYLYVISICSFHSK